jgi:hypothetical protein
MRRAVLTALSMACLAGCDGATFVRGTVSSTDGKPINGAAVRLSLRGGRSDSAATDSGGRFHVGLVHAPSGRVRSTLNVVATGFRTTTIELVGTASYDCSVTMEVAAVQPLAPAAVAREKVCTRRR